MWNEEQSALIPAQSDPIAVDSEHLGDEFGRGTTSGNAVKVLCKYWSKIFCNMSINPFINGEKYV